MVPTAWPAIRCSSAWCLPKRPAIDILAQQAAEVIQLPQWDESQVTDADEAVVISHNWAELRRFMWDYVGIVRTTKRLQRAQHRIQLLHEEINEYYTHFHVSADLLELQKSGDERRSHRPKRAFTPRKSRPALQQGLSGNAATGDTEHTDTAQLPAPGVTLLSHGKHHES